MAENSTEIEDKPKDKQNAEGEKLEIINVDGEKEEDRSKPPPSLLKEGGAPATEPYNHLKQQEIARKKIAYSLVGILAGTTLLSFWYLFELPLNDNTKKYTENLVLLLQIVFGPIITLTGTAVGYYFGANTGNKNS